MDFYLTLPINERKLQDLVHDAKDFVYGLGKEFGNDISTVQNTITRLVVIMLFIFLRTRKGYQQ